MMTKVNVQDWIKHCRRQKPPSILLQTHCCGDLSQPVSGYDTLFMWHVMKRTETW